LATPDGSAISLVEVGSALRSIAPARASHDVDGRSYLDANSSWWVASLGHAQLRASSPRFAKCGRAPAHRLLLAGIAHEGAAPSGRAFVAVARPHRSLYSDNGLPQITEVADRLWCNTGKIVSKTKRNASSP
jgi:adenosylmethionine-8-amino-7-oxononanoate aminotransferase